MSFSNFITSVALIIIPKLLTETFIVEMWWLMVWGNSLHQWLNLVQTDTPGIISQKSKWYLIQQSDSVPCQHVEIQTTAPRRNQALATQLQPMLLISLGSDSDTFDGMKFIWISAL